MNRWMLAAVLCSGWALVNAQSPFDPSCLEEAGRIREHLEVFTDRTIYVVNEPVRFRADLRVEGLESTPSWSGVLYVELISASGQTLAGAKYGIERGISKGSLVIPSGLPTGSYYLKCYTRWMRNWGPASFRYLQIRIINPFKPEVAFESGGSRVAPGPEIRPQRTGSLEIEDLSAHYNSGEEVMMRIGLHGYGAPDSLNCCVTVVPLGTIDTLAFQYTPLASGRDPNSFSLDFLPELEGPSLSGRVNQSGGGPGPYTRLHFSLLGERPDYLATVTDNEGRFVISTPDRRGGQEFFVAPEPLGEAGVEVRIDQDFDQVELLLPAHEFVLTELEREAATRMSVNMQLAKAYGLEMWKVPRNTDTAGMGFIPFYGTPVTRVEMDDFVDLPSLEEVFVNLVPEVYVVKKRNRSMLKIHSQNSAIDIYPPLIMVDYIPVFDQEEVLALVPEKISRVDVINEVYIKGSMFFGGVVSIFSRRGDMAGVDLPQGSYFFDFRSLEPSGQEVERVTQPGDRIPDTRNTLLWRDEVPVGQGSSTRLLFKAPDRRGEYLVMIRGTTPRGETEVAKARFRVQ
jgi:hypothetical protein